MSVICWMTTLRGNVDRKSQSLFASIANQAKKLWKDSPREGERGTCGDKKTKPTQKKTKVQNLKTIIDLQGIRSRGDSSGRQEDSRPVR